MSDSPGGKFRVVLLQDPCVYCGEDSVVTDHIVARALGGSNSWENLAGACRRCNRRKGDRSLLSFLGLQRSGLLERLASVQRECQDWALLGRQA